MTTPQAPTEVAARPWRLLVVAAEAVAGPELRAAVVERGKGRPMSVWVVAPALTDSRFAHAAGAVDDAIAAAQERLEHSLEEIRAAGFEPRGVVGDSDLHLAIEDALRRFDADEILLVAHRENPPPLEREGIAEAERTAAVPIVELYTEPGPEGPAVAEVDRVEPSADPEGPREERNLPRFSNIDLGGIIAAMVGTIALVVLAANCGEEGLNTQGGFGDESGALDGCVIRQLIAGGMALINIAHVVGLTLMEAGPYRGFWRDFFARLSLYGTPTAIVVSLLVV